MNLYSDFNIPGFEIREQLGETHYSSVFRASDMARDRSVIIKFIRINNPSPAAVARLRHEYELIRGLSIEGIVQPIDFITHGGIFALILEDFGGISLKEVLPQGFTLDRFLSLAIKISEILGQLHLANVSHRDIKPHNILVNTQTDTLKITDFGISAEITHAHDDMGAQGFEGTMAYISPEQTGRMNCGVDSRTDLYSLGVTFYEMLTGRLPFKFSDPMETIHAHIAKVPEPPSTISPYVPKPLSDIVMKLLSKSPGDRYQNCLGLAADLQECRSQLAEKNSISPFELGTKDISLRFFDSLHLVGREEQIKVLYQSFDRISQGSVEMLLINGEPGIGKSSLVSEIQKPIWDKQGFFLSGKFNPFQGEAPYSVFIQAFQGLMQQLLSGNDQQLDVWTERLADAVGHNGKILTDTIPEAERILGQQPDVPELGPEETQNRFNLVFKNVVRIFADKAHPLVIFIDDMQWADTASLNLLSTIISDRGLTHCLFVCTCQNTKVAPDHPFVKTRSAIEKTGIPVHSIHLEPLTPQNIQQLIASTIRCENSQTLELAHVVFDKTQGSPFFINQFLKNLYDKNLLHLAVNQGWVWDLTRIREMQATENVVEFMADKLHALPEESLEVITLCACIGHDFDLDTLAEVSGRPMDELLPIMDTFIKDGLIIRANDRHLFYHNRIFEAAYSLVSEEDRKRIHYRIGMFELDKTPENKLHKQIFIICDHLNQAGDQITDESQKIRLAELNLKAGIKAKESAAYDAALTYFEKGCDYLPDDAWQTQYPLAYSLFSEQMEGQYLCMHFDESKRIFDHITANAKTLVEQAQAYNTMIDLYTVTRSAKETIEFGLNALSKLFNIRISKDVGPIAVLKELIKVKIKLFNRNIQQIEELPTINNAEMEACLKMAYILCTSAFYYNRNLFAVLSARGVNLALSHDSSWTFSSEGYIALATMFQTVFGEYDNAYRLAEVALELNKRLLYRNKSGAIHHIFAFFIQHWKKHARHNVDIYRKGHRLSMEAGDFMYAGHSVNACTDCQIMIGKPLDDIYRENNSHTDLMNIVKDSLIAARHKENNRFILCLKGETEKREALSGEDYDEQAYIDRLIEEKNFFGLTYTLHYKVKLLYLYGMYDQALAANAELLPYINIQLGTMVHAEHVFYHSLLLTGFMIRQKKSYPTFRLRIRRNLKKLKKWASLCPDNFKHKFDLVKAETFACKGSFRKALAYYHRAINGARQNGYINEEALACERLALFYLDHEKKDEAGIFITRAYNHYGAWGAQAKQDHILEAHPDFFQHLPPQKTGKHLSSSTGTTSLTSSLDLTTVIKLSQIISSEIMLDRLLEKTMHMSITNAGAERGCLIFEQGTIQLVQASEDINTGEKMVMQAVPVDQCELLSPSIVNYVHHSGESLIIDDAINQGAFVNDPHVVKYQCRSILCIPVVNNDTLICTVYMENNLAANAFTADRLETLRVITSQAAISLQNARLYDTITREIAERKKAEEAMGISEAKYRSILEEMQDVYCETDLEGNVTFVNPSACIFTGYTPSELIGSSFRKIIHGTDQKNLEQYYINIRSTGRPGKPMACTLIGKNDKTLPLEIITSLVKNKSGDITGFRNVGRDVSERKRLEHDLVESSKHIQAARAATILGLAKLAEYRDEDTGTHLERMREYAKIIAQELSQKPEYRAYITPDYIEDIYQSSILHDIGKVGVPDAILLKPGKLTTQEFEIIKTHATLGGDALAAVERQTEGQTFLTLGKEIAYYHHEKWDGTGYPTGLKGPQIPLSARIVALADVYDALTSRRVYKEAFTHEKALDIIRQDRGTHFAPDIVDAFLVRAEEFRRIRDELADEPPLEKQAV